MESKQIVKAVFGTVFKVVIAAIVIMYVYQFSITAYDYGFRIFGEEPISLAPGETKTVAVLEGRSVKEIGETLVDKGLIRDAKLFVIQELLSDYRGEMKPGVYELNTSMMVEDMIEIMAAGEESGESSEVSTETSTETSTEESTVTVESTE